jgi:hypothetical protein
MVFLIFSGTERMSTPYLGGIATAQQVKLARPSVDETAHVVELKVRIGRLALREEAAACERDWSAAMRTVLGRTALQECRHRLEASRWSSDRG